MNRSRELAVRLSAVLLVLVLACLAYLVFWRSGPAPLVVYCAHDSVYSDRVLRKFSEETGCRFEASVETRSTTKGALRRLACGAVTYPAAQ